MAELGNIELIDRLAGYGALGAFAWELDPDHTRSVAQRLRRMVDAHESPGYVERVADPLYPTATKFRVTKPLRASVEAVQSEAGGGEDG